MKSDEFISALTAALTERGVPEQIAASQVKKLAEAISKDSELDPEEIVYGDNLTGMADELAEKILRHFPEKTDSSPLQSFEAESVPNASLHDINDALDRVFEDDADGGKNSRTPDDDVELIFSRPRNLEETDPPKDAGAYAATQIEPQMQNTADAVFAFAPPPESALYTQTFQTPDASPYATQTATGAGATAAQIGNTSAADLNTDTIAVRPGNDYSGISYVFENDADISQYAPGSEMLARMGLAEKTYDKDTIDTRKDRSSKKKPELPPLPEIRETAEGKRRFLTIAICLSPVIAVVAVLYFALWGAVFAAEGAIIAALIGAIIAVAASGTLASVFGIIYGIVKLTSQWSEGIFEIGLGIVVAGATLLCGVLIYNLALRFMPWVIKKTAFLCRLCTRYIHIAIINYRGRSSEK